MNPDVYKDNFPQNHDYSFWKASKIYNDVQLCREANTIIVVNIWLNSLKRIAQYYKDVYQNSRMRLEYAYLLFNEFTMNRINSEFIRIRLNFDIVFGDKN